MPPPSSPGPGGPSMTVPASLSHFVIFNPTIRPVVQASEDKDEQDDLREAAQILFYTSREAGGVSRDKMLRQVGLAKGLMGFADMLTKDDTKYWSIHAYRSRLIIYSPEPDFYIYISINLAHTSLEGKRGDPTSAAQGLEDQLFVDALARGFEDFRLLHGPLSSHLPPTPALSSILDKYFTRFALTFESTYLIEPPALSSWIGGFPEPALDIGVDVKALITEIEAASYLLVASKDGPLYVDGRLTDQTLIRHGVHLVQASLPPPAIVEADSPPRDSRSALGFGLNFGLGRKKDESRKSSWATLGGWVPEIRRSSTPTVVPASPGASHESRIPQLGGEGDAQAKEKDKTKWTFGMGGIGDAVGNVGTVFGLGGPTKPVDEVTAPQDVPATVIAPVVNADPHHVEQTAISLLELEDAVEPDTDLGWETKTVWVRGVGHPGYDQRQLSWIIRDTTLLGIVSTNDVRSPNLPSSPTVSSFFSKVAALNVSSTPSVPSTSTSTNPSIYRLADNVVEKSGEVDTASEQSLLELRGALLQNSAISEIYARTAASRFVVAKRTAEQEIYMLVGRKDASLTDAEQAVRSFSRAHPEFA